MNTKRLTFVAALGVAVLLAAGCSTHTAGGTHSTPTASVPASLPAGWASEDVKFAQMMVPHHQQAVDAANIVLSNPNASQRLREHAQQVIAAQQSEITLMNGWLAEVGAEPLPADQHSGAGHEGHGMDSMNNDALAAASGPEELEAEWVKQMVPHHEGAVLMSEEVLKTTTNPEVKKLAEEIITAQDSEIKMLKSWVTPANQ